MIQASGVRKGFKGKQVLAGVDLEVPRGSVVGLLGRNGAGKTTLIKCLLGLLRIERGTITLLDEDPWTLSGPAKERLGYGPQEPSLYAWMTVQQIVNYTAAFYPHWNYALSSQLVKEWDLNPRAKVGPLSPGERQKLAIILALGHEPELLIFDEPVASLDPASRREFLAMILKLTSERQPTILFSTHITFDLERIADRVAILKAGVMIYHDELDKLKESVKRLHIRAPSVLPLSFTVPGMLRRELDGQEALVSVREVSEELLSSIAQQWSATVEVRDLNLEDIFLELHHA
jgi:ABC-2 type transport system ATP-binding protein